MPVPTLNSWADEAVVDGTTLNTYVRDPQAWFLGLPTFHGRNTSATVLTQSTATAVPINAEDRNVGFTHTTNDTKVYATMAGWYRYVITASFTSGTTFGNVGLRAAQLRKNGTTATEGGVTTGTVPAASDGTQLGGRSGFVYLNGSTDYVELVMTQGAASGSSITTEVSTTAAQSSITLLWQGRDA